ncbi:5-oxoprolinase subunit C family protein [Pseudooceanicola sp. 502str34]
MSLTVLSSSPMLTVQDRGRPGWRQFGVSAAGAMDPGALRLANALCGNDAEAAALEFGGFGGRFKTDRPLRFAVTGGACEIRLGERLLQPDESHRLEPGEVLSIGALRGATWGYVAFSGGIATPEVMGARSTHLRFGVGGLDGRRLQDGDALPLQEDAPGPLLRAPAPVPSRADQPIRVLAGPQDDYFDATILARLESEDFALTAQRDRMASVLDGPDLPARGGHDIISDGTMPGAIQVPGSGKPIVLMAECQTTGGYPKIATVITADRPRLAQMPTGTRFRFARVTREEAEAALRQATGALHARIAALAEKPADPFASDYLLSCDLVGGIFDPEALMEGGPS